MFGEGMVGVTSGADDVFFSPKPEGYVLGKTKYVIITGSVISGNGKGTASSTIAKTLQDRGLSVEPMKLESYLNVDSGTLNPFRHGEVFVLDDGTETDLDLGTYERMLNKDLTKDNFVTSGTILSRVLEKERRGDYLGKDVQVIPHVTGEIKFAVRCVAAKTKADVVLVEIGGTVGDYENVYSLEALREMAYEEGRDNFCFVNLTYILEPSSLGEQKSKAAQLGIKNLMQLGIQPDIVLCRAKNPVGEGIRRKISLFGNVPYERVFSAQDVDNIYSLPLFFREKGIDEEICKVLGLADKFPAVNNEVLESFVRKARVYDSSKDIIVGMAAKYIGASDTYLSVVKALEHAGFALGVRINIAWIDTQAIEEGVVKVEEALKGVDALVVPGGFGSRGIEGKIECIRYCREHHIPFLGLCYGFQLALVEFARNVLGLEGAHTTEVDLETMHPVIDLLPEQRTMNAKGGTMRLGGHDVVLIEGTRARQLHDGEIIRRRFRHRYECNPEYIKVFEEKGIIFSGRARNDEGRIMQVLEMSQTEHPFFMAVQFHPEFTSRPLRPDPLFFELIKTGSKSSFAKALSVSANI